MQVTVFKNIIDSTNPYYVKPLQIYNYIKNGRYKDHVERIRMMPEKKERDKIKAKLPSICWSGKFTKRGNDFCTEHSGLVCIDFDHVNNLDEFKARINKDQYTYMSFISPSGDGLKVIIKIPASIKTHAESCKALTKYYKEETLDEFRDVARVCYISFDPNIYINEKSNVFSKLLPEKETKQQVFYTKETVNDTNEIFDRIITWLNNNYETYTDGNKHNYLVKLSAACLRFGIPEYECSQRLYFNFANKASKVSQEDINKIVQRVYSNYSSTACTANFEKNGDPIFTATKKQITKDIINISFHDKDIIYLENVKQSMFDGFKTGKSRGTTTHFKSFDKHWTWIKKQLNFLGGIGNMGKTAMLFNLCVLKALNDGWKFAVFSPEQDPPDDFYNDLIHTYVGMSTEPYHENQMSEEQYKKAMDFIGKHFFYIFPETESPTPEYINLCFEESIKKHKVDCCIIDPFNQLDNDWKKFNRDDLYISEFLSKNKRFAQKHNISYFIVGHPKSSVQMKGGNYECPNVYDYAGGAMWLNKCDNILAYHRPFATSDPEDTTCWFISQKIKKRKITGVPGYSVMNFNVFENRFIEDDGNNPFTKFNDKTINLDAHFEPNKEFEEETECPF